jgi:hypothetical protein
VTGTVTTTESQILEQMRAANNQTLTAREVRIVEIQDELLGLQSARSRTGDSDEIAAQERVLLLELERLGATATERLSLLTNAGERREFFSNQLNTIYEQLQLRIREEDFPAAEQLIFDAAQLVESPIVREDPSLNIVSLLNTRVLLRAVVDSPTVRDQYPGLYDQMEEYFVAFETDRIAQGSQETLEWATETVRSLGAGIGLGLSEEKVETQADYLSLLAELVAGALWVGMP